MAKRKAAVPDPAVARDKFGVFISWSGKPSQQIAEALRELVSNVFQDVDAFVSSNDIDAGSNWFGTVTTKLEATDFGAICLTPDNITKEWIHFEAGALAKKTTEKAKVVPYLHGLSPSVLGPPLSLFQAVQADKEGTLHLLSSINKYRINIFERSKLNDIFDKWWPDFEQKLVTLPSTTTTAPPRRSEHDLLNEILSILRGFQAGGRVESGLGLTPESALPTGLSLETLRAQLALKLSDVQLKRIESTDVNNIYNLDNLIRFLEMQLSRLDRIAR